jgi:peptidoglycan hydrolase-like protein with peptidoglycan-binding domain
VLLYGGHPDWRRMAPGVVGPDVVQLEDDLIALGYATTATLHDDGVFTSADAAAVMRFQAALGVSQTGFLAAGEILFEPGPVRVTAVPVLLGAPLQPGEPVLQVTGTSHLVTVQLDASRQGVVKAGDAVSVLMPDGTTTVNGHLATVSRVANQPPNNGNQGGPAQSATVDAGVTLDDESKAGTLDLAPVYVSIAAATHKGVLAVPVIALLAQPDGGYAVSLTAGGARHTVTVQPGLFGDGGLVEVSGSGLNAGDVVLVPAR